MFSKVDKNANRVRRHIRLRRNLAGTTARPRLAVYRSTKSIYAQIIDDTKGVTLVASNTLQPEIAKACENLTKVEAARLVGQDIAKKAIAKGITEVVFDRGGYLYIGRVQSLADGAREAGLKF